MELGLQDWQDAIADGTFPRRQDSAVEMHEGDGHAALAHAGRDGLDRAVADVALAHVLVDFIKFEGFDDVTNRLSPPVSTGIIG